MYNETYGYNREIAWYKNDKNVKCDIIYMWFNIVRIFHFLNTWKLYKSYNTIKFIKISVNIYKPLN